MPSNDDDLIYHRLSENERALFTAIETVIEVLIGTKTVSASGLANVFDLQAENSRATPADFRANPDVFRAFAEACRKRDELHQLHEKPSAGSA